MPGSPVSARSDEVVQRLADRLADAGHEGDLLLREPPGLRVAEPPDAVHQTIRLIRLEAQDPLPVTEAEPARRVGEHVGELPPHDAVLGQQPAQAGTDETVIVCQQDADLVGHGSAVRGCEGDAGGDPRAVAGGRGNGKRATGKLGALLAQFPPSFKASEETREQLDDLPRREIGEQVPDGGRRRMDHEAGAVVLSHRLWATRFGNDPQILGRTLD